MDIDNMPAGREMDALIAEKAMEQLREYSPGRWCFKCSLAICEFPNGVKDRFQLDEDGEKRWEQGNGNRWFTQAIPRYSTDIAAAWEVVKYMKKQGWSFRFGNNACTDGQNAAAFFQKYRGLGRDILTGDYVYDDKAWAVDDECPAICRAALKALGVQP